MGQKNNYRILMFGDQGEFADGVTRALETIGCDVIGPITVGDAAQTVGDDSTDLVALVLPMAAADGQGLCRDIRSASRVPIVSISSTNAEKICVEQLGAGADDVIAAPYSLRTLEARIHAVIRRGNSEPYRSGAALRDSQPEPGRFLRVGVIQLDLTTCRVSVNGAVSTLTPNEFRLLAIFMRSPDLVFTREELRRQVWPDDQHSLHLVEVHIANLRAKIEADPHHPTFIVTVRSRGYKFATPA